MAAYILRRLLLVIPTLLGIMIINFVLTQFVPGGPIEQIIAKMEGGGDEEAADVGAHGTVGAHALACVGGAQGEKKGGEKRGEHGGRRSGAG